MIVTAFWGGLGLGETLLILTAVLLLFGAKRLPDVARRLGKALEEFRRAARSVSDEFQQGQASASDASSAPRLNAARTHGRNEPDAAGPEDDPYAESHADPTEAAHHEQPRSGE